jgi:hypothetical protein
MPKPMVMPDWGEKVVSVAVSVPCVVTVKGWNTAVPAWIVPLKVSVT